MSASAAGLSGPRAARFWNATIGKKVTMAVTGLGLFGFVCAHLLGNLNFYRGREAMDAYGRFLRVEPALLNAARAGLLLMVVLHIWASVKLALLNKFEARPVGYVKKKSIVSSYASRTMCWSGPIILVFVIYHLLQFTWGIGGTAFEEGHPYDNLVVGFGNPFIVLFYIVAMGMLMLHLYHGIWSMFQTLGVSNPRLMGGLRTAAKAISILLFLGFCSIPVSILAGVRP